MRRRTPSLSGTFEPRSSNFIYYFWSFPWCLGREILLHACRTRSWRSLALLPFPARMGLLRMRDSCWGPCILILPLSVSRRCITSLPEVGCDQVWCWPCFALSLTKEDGLDCEPEAQHVGSLIEIRRFHSSTKPSTLWRTKHFRIKRFIRMTTGTGMFGELFVYSTRVWQSCWVSCVAGDQMEIVITLESRRLRNTWCYEKRTVRKQGVGPTSSDISWEHAHCLCVGVAPSGQLLVQSNPKFPYCVRTLWFLVCGTLTVSCLVEYAIDAHKRTAAASCSIWSSLSIFFPFSSVDQLQHFLYHVHFSITQLEARELETP